MRLFAALLLLIALAGCANHPDRDTALEGYLPPGEVEGGPNKLFGTTGVLIQPRILTPW